MQLCVFKSDYDSPSPALSLPECSLCRFVNQPPHLAMGSLGRRSNPGTEASAVRHIQHTSPLIHREIGATFHLVFSQPSAQAKGPVKNIVKPIRASPLIRTGCLSFHSIINHQANDGLSIPFFPTHSFGKQ